MEPKPKDPKPPRYKPAVLDCPRCGEHIEGDIPVISHTIMGCKPKEIPVGMYNMVFGVNLNSHTILSTLGLTINDVGRFRDAFVCGDEIAVYTRNGGGNRQDYKDVFKKLQSHPHYLRDEDDKFDSTYATIYFSLPSAFKELLVSMDTGPFNPDARWLNYIAGLKEKKV